MILHFKSFVATVRGSFLTEYRWLQFWSAMCWNWFKRGWGNGCGIEKRELTPNLQYNTTEDKRHCLLLLPDRVLCCHMIRLVRNLTYSTGSESLAGKPCALLRHSCISMQGFSIITKINHADPFSEARDQCSAGTNCIGDSYYTAAQCNCIWPCVVLLQMQVFRLLLFLFDFGLVFFFLQEHAPIMFSGSCFAEGQCCVCVCMFVCRFLLHLH